MNYQELEAKFKLGKDKLAKLLKAAEVSPDLTDFKPHVQKLEGILAAAGESQDYEGAAKKYKEQSAIKKGTAPGDRPLPELANQAPLKKVVDVDLTGIPVEDGVAKTWGEVAKAGATSDADALAGAPFDGIIEGSDYVNEKAESLKQHGFNLYMEKFDEAMHDPELAKRIENKYLGKFPARWNLKPKN